MDNLDLTIRVKALQPQRRRAGMLFTREPRDLTPADFGEGLEAGEMLLALVSDPQLVVTGIDAEGGEHAVTAEMVDELEELIAADRQAATDPVGSVPAEGAEPGQGDVNEPDQANAPEPEPEKAPAPEPDPTPPPAKPSGRTKGKPAKE